MLIKRLVLSDLNNFREFIRGFFLLSFKYKYKANKQVLPRERKRHTAHRVASATSAVLSQGGGYPIHGWGCTPVLTWLGGGGGTPSWVPPWEQTWDQSLGYPQKGYGTSGSIMGCRWCSPRFEQADTCENSTFPSYYALGR